MSDKFGRHKSTRWVKASVPTYGDEWDDDYGYDYDYGSPHDDDASETGSLQQEKEIEPLLKKQSHLDEFKPLEPHPKEEAGNQPQQQSPTSSLKKSESHHLQPSSQSSEPPLSGLVLSIDTMKHRTDDDLDSSDEEEVYNPSTHHPAEGQGLQRQGTIQNPISVDTSLNDTSAHVEKTNDSFDFSPVSSEVPPPLPSGTNDPAQTTKSSSSINTATLPNAAPRSVPSVSRSINSSSSSLSKKPAGRRPPSIAVVGRDNSQDSFAPPTPTFNSNRDGVFGSNHAPETPSSEMSYQSDADSIQAEPTDLNVASPNTRKELSPKNTQGLEGTNLLGVIDEAELTNNSATSPPPSDSKAAPEPPSFNAHEDSVEDDSLSLNDQGGAPAPLVLSIDNRVDEDDSSDDDDWGYNSQHSSNNDHNSKEGGLGLNISKSSDLLSKTTSGSNARPIKTDALDSLINDLERASFNASNEDVHHPEPSNHENNNEHSMDESYNTSNDDTNDKSFLPKLDSIHNFSLPDFENKSFGDYDSKHVPPLDLDQILNNADDSELPPPSASSKYSTLPPTPVAPLSYTQAKKGHEDFINELSGHKPSIRKPPPAVVSTIDENKEISNDTPGAAEDAEAKEQPNRSELVSVDYSNIADAVSGYIDTDAASRKDRDSLAVDYGVVDTDKNASTGSLSTGKFSVDSHSKSLEQRERTPSIVESTLEEQDRKPDDMSRRVSTMSQSTFNMGSWQPNTGNFRDQFIKDNDNESQINFNPYASESNYYNKFTRARTNSGISLSDGASSASSISVPDTIDVGLPSIHEDNDDDVTDDDGSFNSHRSQDNGRLGSRGDVESSSTNDDNKLEGSKTFDSVLADQPMMRPVFKEEGLTPQHSQDNLSVVKHPKSDDAKSPQTQKYSSLLGNDSTTASTVSEKRSSVGTITDMITSSHKRLLSSASNVTSESQQPKKPTSTSTPTQIQLPSPAYNWKQIMATSQPIDRIRLLKDALQKETKYDTGLSNWLNETLKSSQNSSNMHIGKIATQAYRDATHNDIRRHTSIRSKVSIVKDKVETSGLSASNIGKRFLNRGKKLMKSSGGD